jgi:hypothetical protein
MVCSPYQHGLRRLVLLSCDIWADLRGGSWSARPNEVRVMAGIVENDGPHIARDVSVSVTSENGAAITALSATGAACDAGSCVLGTVPPDTRRRFYVTVEFEQTADTDDPVAVTATISTSSPDSSIGDNTDRDEFGVDGDPLPEPPSPSTPNPPLPPSPPQPTTPAPQPPVTTTTTPTTISPTDATPASSTLMLAGPLALASAAGRQLVVHRGSRVRLSGTVTPAGAGRTVTVRLLQRVSGHWRVRAIRTARAAASTGSFALLTPKLPGRGRWKAQLRVVATAAASSASSSVSLVVR